MDSKGMQRLGLKAGSAEQSRVEKAKLPVNLCRCLLS